MAGSQISVWVGVESVADTASITGAESPSYFTVGGDITFWYLADESVDLVEKIHISIILCGHMSKMDAFKPYPFGVDGGIDFGVFGGEYVCGGQVAVPTGSGKPLTGMMVINRLSGLTVEVHVPAWKYGSIEYRMRGNAIYGEVGFDLLTRNFDGATLGPRYPDFFAPAFIGCFLQWVNDQGVRIDKWVSVWGPTSINLKQFNDFISFGETEKSAALATWSGQVAVDNKFTKYRGINPLPDGKMKVTFSR